jgi:hypothetical protein
MVIRHPTPHRLRVWLCGHEATDATAKSILWFTIYLTITLAATILIIAGVFLRIHADGR